MNNLGQVLATILLYAILIALVFGGGATFFITKWAYDKPIRSKVRLVPIIELVTDGKTVDTIFIYQSNKP